MTTPEQPPKELPQRSLSQWLADMPRWKKLTLAVAAGTAVVAGVMSLTHTGHSGHGSGGGLSSLSAGLTDDKSAAAGEPAAKGVFRLGFSFVAGFSLGSFVRAALRVAAIAFGFWLLMTMVLSYYGILVVHWEAMDSLWNRFASNVEKEWSSFQTFMTGSLPAAGLFTAGLAIGLKRH
ncbi:MAG: FUN14 domain-containing protein [Planctomycetes bacterium]|nr:FUN14 domain-containing protein [Planctomycetota bacterium]